MIIQLYFIPKLRSKIKKFSLVTFKTSLLQQEKFYNSTSNTLTTLNKTKLLTPIYRAFLFLTRSSIIEQSPEHNKGEDIRLPYRSFRYSNTELPNMFPLRWSLVYTHSVHTYPHTHAYIQISLTHGIRPTWAW